jgi:hypothetical protein
MTLLQRVVDEHFRRLEAARRQRRLDDFASISAVYASLDDGDAGDGYDGWLPEAEQWRGTE